MSWIDRINNVTLKIVTGEGSEFTPLYKSPSRSRNMNASVFNFNNIEGSLVKRGKAESMKYPFELHFTGIDHLDESERFNIASLDPRPWTLISPEYGTISVQPISLNYSDSTPNDTVVTGELFETIEDTYPNSSIGVKESVIEAVEIAVNNSVNNMNLEKPTSSLSALAASSIANITNRLKLQSLTEIDLQNVQNKSNEALSALNEITSDPVAYMNKAAELFRTPAKFYSRVRDRINVLKESYDDLKSSMRLNSTVQEKLYFEASSSVLISAMAESSVTNVSDIASDQQIENNTLVDFKTRSEVIEVSELLRSILADFFETLGELQSAIDATPESYTPKQSTTNTLKEAINKASGALLQIAVKTKQERVYTLKEPIGIIMLVHRLLGKTDNETIQDFAENNNILLDEWLQLPQGREVVYYL